MTVPGSPELAKSIEQFLAQPDLEAKINYLRAHPSLLSDDALRVFDRLRDAFVSAGDPDFAETLASHRALAERARDVGVTKAFEEMRYLLLAERFEEFIAARSWMDSYVYLEKHPELTFPAVRDIVTVLEERARRSGDEEKAKIIHVHGSLLYLVHTIGADAAFIQIGGMDFLNSTHPGD
jgi:hypothetical protein